MERAQLRDWTEERAVWLATLNQRSVATELDAIQARTATARRALEAEGVAARALHELIDGLRSGDPASARVAISTISALTEWLKQGPADAAPPTAALDLCDQVAARLQALANSPEREQGRLTPRQVGEARL